MADTGPACLGREGISMRCVILQPSYIPWRGYFHQIQKADLFVFCDDVQYDRHGWRNRNRVKGPDGIQWLTIPALCKGSVTNQIPIYRIRINWDRQWNKRHWGTIQQFYGRAPYFRLYKAMLQDFYSCHYQYLADFTVELTIALAKVLGMKNTRFIRSSEVTSSRLTKMDRILTILKHVGATHYISGPSAKVYLQEEKLLSAGITLEYMDYNYPEYSQLYGPYDPYVSILDLLFMTGPSAPQYVWNVPAQDQALAGNGRETRELSAFAGQGEIRG
jgi:hypothetical protein